MFAGFKTLSVQTANVEFSGVIGGSGPVVLLLHGFPQNHLTWRFIAPALAQNYTVIAPDLPGYGNSKIQGEGSRWTKRRVASEIAELMSALGHERFAIIGHDRGARVGYRLALDHTQRVTNYTSLTVIPTLDAWKNTDREFGLKNYHWFMLAQPDDLPERLLASDPLAFIDDVLLKMAGSLDRFEPEILTAYRDAFSNPAVRHAMCEDYRAGAFDDLEIDRCDRNAGNKMKCPVCVIWPDSDGPHGSSPVATWEQWADDVTGHAVEGNHLLPEFSADVVLHHVRAFLAKATPSLAEQRPLSDSDIIS